MPLEVRELVIKATIVSEASASAGQGSGSSGEGGGSAEIVQLCVEKVLEILKEKNER